ncbi:MAG: hypothetical protein AB1324_06975, partial [Candidatus Micrarchaeota archaeon]
AAGAAAYMLTTSAFMIGSNLYSTFDIGGVSNMLATPLLLLSVALYRRSLLGSAALASAVILCHFLMPLVLFLWIAVIAATDFMKGGGRETLLRFGAFLALSFLLPAFWLVPTILTFAHLEGHSSHPALAFSLDPLMAALSFVAAGMMMLKGKWELPLMLIALALTVSIDTDALPFGLPVFRFAGFYLLVAFMMIGAAAGENLPNLAGKAMLLAFILYLAAGMDNALKDSQSSNLYYSYERNESPFTGYEFGGMEFAGRTIVYDGEPRPYIHALPFVFAAQSGMPAVKGLFIEEAPAGQIALSYQKEIFPETFVWVPYLDAREFTGAMDREAVKFYSDLFWVRGILSTKRLFLFGEGEKVVAGNRTLFYYRMGNSSLAQALGKAEPACGDWREFKENWYRKGNRTIYYLDCGGESLGGNGTVDVLDYRAGSIDIEIEGEEPAPVLVKEAYHPRWRAYDAEGNAIRVYRATPDFMMVVSKGPVRLRYEPQWFDYAGAGLSLTGAAALLLHRMKASPSAGGRSP